MSQVLKSPRLRLWSHGVTIPYIMIPTSMLDAVQHLLESHHVEYWLDDVAISLDGEPEFTVMNLPKADSSWVQKLLDSLPDAP